MSLNILLIDQNKELCGDIKRFLLSEGHAAFFCSGEQSCLQKALDIAPDLIIIEVAMPEHQAIEIVKKLHRTQTTRNIPVIIISDFSELELELLHIFDFICKPIDLRRLREDLNILASGAKNRSSVIKLLPLTNEEHEKFHDFLIKHCGLHFERRNIRVLERGLGSRMTALRLSSYSDYYEYLCKNMDRRQELQKLLQLLTVGETFFFRYQSHFKALGRTVLPQLVNATQQKSVRIWSAGCSTGEEPYSIAMTIMENIPDWKNRDIKIIATDINNRSLSRAREGVYNAWALRVTEQGYIDKYFKRIGESYVVRDEVKSLVEFSYLNLQATPFPAEESIDVIFCRNVMIYFTSTTTRKIVANLTDSLKPGGHLFLGHSETLIQISTKFERHVLDGGFYYRKKSPTAHPSMTATAEPVATAKSSRPAQNPPARTAPSVMQKLNPEQLLDKGLNLLLQENFAAAAVIFKDILAKNPDHTVALMGMAQILMASGRIDDALDRCNRAITADDLLPEGYFLRGLIYELHEMENESFDEYRKAILLKMDFVMPHYLLGRLWFRSGDHKSGLRELRNCLKLLEKTSRETIIPFSGGLSREVFIGQLRLEIERVEKVIATETV